MSLKGSIKTMPLADLLLFLADHESTGTLELSRGSDWTRLYFEQGRIISSSSSDPKEWLGHFLISKNRITEDQLTEAMQVQGRTRVMLGKILVMIGAVTEEELIEMLETKCAESILSLFLWDDAGFEFVDNELPQVRMIFTSLAAHPLVEKGLLRLEDWRRLTQEYPSILMRFDKTARPADDLDDLFIQTIYDLVDGHRTIGDIGLQVHASDYRVLHALDQLRKQNLISVSGQGPHQQAIGAIALSSEQLIETGKNKLIFGKWEEAINLFKYVVNRDHKNREAVSMLNEAESALLKYLYEEVLPPDSIPRLTRPLQLLVKEKLDEEERFLVSRINERWDIKTILAVVPLREIDALRAFKRLLDRHLIEVRKD